MTTIKTASVLLIEVTRLQERRHHLSLWYRDTGCGEGLGQQSPLANWVDNACGEPWVTSTSRTMCICLACFSESVWQANWQHSYSLLGLDILTYLLLYGIDLMMLLD